MKVATVTKSFAKPQNHQREAIKAGIKYFVSNDNGKLIMPCGSGKTLTSIWLADAMKMKRLIIALPTLQLQSQSVENWISNIQSDSQKHEIIVVGSNYHIKKKFKDVVVTTSSNVLTQTLLAGNNKPIIILTTYHSSDIVSSVCLENGIKIDMAIFDEAHHTAGVEKATFQALLLKEGLQNIRKKLFMTATPRFFAKSKGDGGEESFFSMDDESVYGKEFYRLSTREAIEQGIISDYRVVTMFTSDSDTARVLALNPLLKTKHGKLTGADAIMIAVAIGVLKSIQKFKLKHIICFTNSIERSKLFTELIEDIANTLKVDIDAFHINHSMTGMERDSILENFYKSECSVISNSRMLGEGIDLPAVDASVFVDEKSSVTSIVQAAGRCWRKAEGKELGYILVPCILNGNKEVISEDMTVLRRVFSALGMYDEVIFDYFKSHNSGSRSGTKQLETAIHIDNPRNFDIEKFNQSLNLSVWRNLSILDRNHNSKYAPWEEAAKFTLGLAEYGITSVKEYGLYCSNPELFPGAPLRPANIPVLLWKAYRKIYKSELFFKLKVRYNNYISCSMAATFIRSLSQYGIENTTDFKKYAKDHRQFPGAPELPRDIPREPWRIYKGEYKASEFFTKGIDYNRAPVHEIKEFVLSLREFGITKRSQWEEYCYHPEKYPGAPTRPANIPIKLSFVLKADYDRNEFFPGSVVDKDMSWQEAANYIKSLGKFGVTNLARWIKYKKNPSSFPLAPQTIPDNIPLAVWVKYKKHYKAERFFSNPGRQEVL